MIPDTCIMTSKWSEKIKILYWWHQAEGEAEATVFPFTGQMSHLTIIRWNEKEPNSYHSNMALELALWFVSLEDLEGFNETLPLSKVLSGQRVSTRELTQSFRNNFLKIIFFFSKKNPKNLEKKKHYKILNHMPLVLSFALPHIFSQWWVYRIKFYCFSNA